MDHLGPPQFRWKVIVPALLVVFAGLIWIFHEEGCGSAEPRLVDRLGFPYGYEKAVRVEIDASEARYVVISFDGIADVGVWATDIHPSGEGPGVVAPANERARGLTKGQPRLKPDTPVARAAANERAVSIAETCGFLPR